jgi:hypothetical protein
MIHQRMATLLQPRDDDGAVSGSVPTDSVELRNISTVAQVHQADSTQSNNAPPPPPAQPTVSVITPPDAGEPPKCQQKAGTATQTRAAKKGTGSGAAAGAGSMGLFHAELQQKMTAMALLQKVNAVFPAPDPDPDQDQDPAGEVADHEWKTE